MANKGSLFYRLKELQPKLQDRVIRRVGAYDYAKDAGLPSEQLHEDLWDAITARNNLNPYTIRNRRDGSRFSGFGEDGMTRWAAPNAQESAGPLEPKVYYGRGGENAAYEDLEKLIGSKRFDEEFAKKLRNSGLEVNSD